MSGSTTAIPTTETQIDKLITALKDVTAELKKCMETVATAPTATPPVATHVASTPVVKQPIYLEHYANNISSSSSSAPSTTLNDWRVINEPTEEDRKKNTIDIAAYVEKNITTTPNKIVIRSTDEHKFNENAEMDSLATGTQITFDADDLSKIKAALATIPDTEISKYITGGKKNRNRSRKNAKKGGKKRRQNTMRR